VLGDLEHQVARLAADRGVGDLERGQQGGQRARREVDVDDRADHLGDFAALKLCHVRFLLRFNP
jgi:hypothetical protein